MKLGTICSGIGAAECASINLPVEPVFTSEVDKYPSDVLRNHFPGVPNAGDILSPDWDMPRDLDLFVAGTPCQSFSQGGTRGGLQDPRGQLTVRFCEIVNEYKPRYTIWENVPGVLSHPDNPFGHVIGSLAGHSVPIRNVGPWPNFGVVRGPDRAVAWRVLDAQYFGVPQRRRRVFVVAGDRLNTRWLDVFFERVSKGGDQAAHPAEKMEDATVTRSWTNEQACWWDGRLTSQCLDAVLYKKQTLPEKQRFPAVLVPAWYQCNNCDDVWCAIHGKHTHECECAPIEDWAELSLSPYDPCHLRWLMPHEVERLFGFPDNWTSGISNTRRYKALGNSMAVPVVKWVMEAVLTGDTQ